MKRYYTKEDIKQMISMDNSNLSNDEIEKRAIEIYRSLNTLEVAWKRSNHRFYANSFLLGDNEVYNKRIINKEVSYDYSNM